MNTINTVFSTDKLYDILPYAESVEKERNRSPEIAALYKTSDELDIAFEKFLRGIISNIQTSEGFAVECFTRLPLESLPDQVTPLDYTNHIILCDLKGLQKTLEVLQQDKTARVERIAYARDCIIKTTKSFAFSPFQEVLFIQYNRFDEKFVESLNESKYRVVFPIKAFIDQNQPYFLKTACDFLASYGPCNMIVGFIGQDEIKSTEKFHFGYFNSSIGSVLFYMETPEPVDYLLKGVPRQDFKKLFTYMQNFSLNKNEKTKKWDRKFYKTIFTTPAHEGLLASSFSIVSNKEMVYQLQHCSSNLIDYDSESRSLYLNSLFDPSDHYANDSQVDVNKLSVETKTFFAQVAKPLNNGFKDLGIKLVVGSWDELRIKLRSIQTKVEIHVLDVTKVHAGVTDGIKKDNYYKELMSDTELFALNSAKNSIILTISYQEKGPQTFSKPFFSLGDILCLTFQPIHQDVEKLA